MGERLFAVGTALGMVALLALALALSAPLPSSVEGYPPPRSLALSIISSLLFLAFLYLHNGRRHAVNIFLTFVFLAYCIMLYLLP